MKVMLRKLLISFLLFSLLATNFLFFVPSISKAQAPGPWYDQGLTEWYLKVYDEQTSPPNEIFGERYTASQVNWIIWSIIMWIPTKILGPRAMACILPLSLQGVIDISGCLRAVGLIANTQTPDGHLAASVSSNKSIVASIFADRPLSGITYVKNIFRKFKLIPEAKAQGFGFLGALDPVLPLWRGSRDIAYTLFVLITIVFAFMIMFRVKISPQTVITVQSALPKLAVAIILVTFSYAIAGFLVDLMYVVIGLVALLTNTFIPGVATETMFGFLTTGPASTGALGLIILYLITFALAAFIVIIATAGGIILALGSILAGAGIIALIASSGGIVAVIAIFIAVVLALLVLWHAIRILWMLLKAFVAVLLLTIFAPFQIAAGTLISNFGFSAWVKSMISNLAVFVVTGVLFVISFLFLNRAVDLALSSVSVPGEPGANILRAMFGGAISSLVAGNYVTGWPPLLGTATTGVGLAFLFLGASLVVFISIPKAADIIKGLLEGKPFSYGSAIGQAVGPVSTVGLPVSMAAAGSIAGGKWPWPISRYAQGDPGKQSQDLARSYKGLMEAILGKRGR